MSFPQRNRNGIRILYQGVMNSFFCPSVKDRVKMGKLWKLNKKGFAVGTELVAQGEFEVLGCQGRVNNKITPQRDDHSFLHDMLGKIGWSHLALSCPLRAGLLSRQPVSLTGYPAI